LLSGDGDSVREFFYKESEVGFYVFEAVAVAGSGVDVCLVSFADDDGVIPIVTLSPEWEKAFSDALVGQGEEQTLALAPSSLQDFINKVRSSFERFAMQGEAPVLLTSPQIRPHVRSVVERFRPATVVLSQNEVHPRAKIRTLGQV